MGAVPSVWKDRPRRFRGDPALDVQNARQEQAGKQQDQGIPKETAHKKTSCCTLSCSSMPRRGRFYADIEINAGIC